MDVERSVTEGYKIWLAGGGALLALAWAWVPARARVLALSALTLVAGLNYARWGPSTLLERVDTYDFIHYYLNAKYFDELGYYDLYPACIVADLDAYGPYFKSADKYLAQDETGHHMMPLAHGVQRGTWVRENQFTPERWEAFSADFLYLQRTVRGLNETLWREMIQDHGFNGTAVWTMIARPFTLVPVTSVKLLGFLDLVLLAGGVAGIAWAYGRTVALWTSFWLLVTYSARWPTITWAFLRYDYLTALMLGMAFLRKGKPFWAGLMTGWAAALRMFPVTWLFGPGAKGLWTLLRERRVLRPMVMLLAGFVVSVGVLQAGATAQFGTEAVTRHFENMEDHQQAENLSSRRIGLALALPFEWELGDKYLSKATKREIEAQKPLRYGIAAGVLLLLGFALRKSDDDEVYAWGFVPFFLITTASYYYYVVRITLAVLHASRLPKPRHAVGLAWLLGLEVFANWAETAHSGYRVFLIGGLAWGILGYILVQAVWLVWESYRPPESLGSLPNGSGTSSAPDGATASAGAAVASIP